ncbi:acyl-CoA dehydrogenase family protein [Actinoallomurus rhizosphaericola]|uniref:acyl-CoA dehydrogenase family protein n=1 Tax=Actinoallomurus rhizosphaericola TaxID=2952536 RepID=UPI0020935DA2|nr:acyl-CoA dehydrogenase family protein [Actinoallomurus rhizosphaericola]MCO5997397.1 acyl-CoA dehydrogenase family protein [Actinoallomurus rhizosphaericola]
MPLDERDVYHRFSKRIDGHPVPASGYLTREEWQWAAGAGLAGLSVSESYGGGGHGFAATAQAAEAFGRHHPDMGLVFAVLAHLFACAMPIAEHGDPALRERVLPRLCSGEWIGANAITEEGAGSDATALATRAVRDGDEYVLTGVKSFVSNGPIADVFVVYASTRPEFGHLGVSAFVIERGTPGLTVGEPFGKAGLVRCPAGELRLDGCRVPAGARLGADGQGAAIFQSAMRWERTCLFAAYLGQSERLLDRCVEHARERRQFGRPLAANQAVSHRIGRMRVRLDAARLLLERACARLDQGERAVLDVAMAKLAVSENAVATALDAQHIFGGAGVREDAGIAKDVRDALPCTTFSGTSEMQLEQIAEELGL